MMGSTSTMVNFALSFTCLVSDFIIISSTSTTFELSGRRKVRGGYTYSFSPGKADSHEMSAPRWRQEFVLIAKINEDVPSEYIAATCSSEVVLMVANCTIIG